MIHRRSYFDVMTEEEYSSYTKGENACQCVFESLNKDVQNALKTLMFFTYLTDNLAKKIIWLTGKSADRFSIKILDEIRGWSIWHEVDRTTWRIDGNVREYILSTMSEEVINKTREGLIDALMQICKTCTPADIGFKDDVRSFHLQVLRLMIKSSRRGVVVDGINAFSKYCIPSIYKGFRIKPYEEAIRVIGEVYLPETPEFGKYYKPHVKGGVIIDIKELPIYTQKALRMMRIAHINRVRNERIYGGAKRFSIE